MKHKGLIAIISLLMLASLCACKTTGAAKDNSGTEESESSYTSQELSMEETDPTPSETESTGSGLEVIRQEVEFALTECLVLEENDYVYRFSSCNQADYQGNTYNFETSLEEEKCIEFIEAQEELLGALDSGSGYTFYVSDSYMNRSDSKNQSGFYLMESIRSWEQILVTLQMLEGDTLHYGYAYGKANSVAKELGWKTDGAVAGDINEIFQEDPGRMNLFMPCFMEKYSTEEQIAAAKAASLEVYSRMKEDSEEAFMEAAEAYGKEIGAEFTPSYLKFWTGGKAYPLIIETRYVREWIWESFKTDVKERVTDDSEGSQDSQDSDAGLSENLSWMRHMSLLVQLRELTDDTIDHVREAFQDSFLEITDLKDVYYVKRGMLPEDFWGYYTERSDKIQVSTAYAIAHEYFHYMNCKCRKDKITDFHRLIWIAEGLSMYYEVPIKVFADRELGREPNLTMEEYEAMYCSHFKTFLDKGIPLSEIVNCHDGAYIMAVYLCETYSEEVYFEFIGHPERVQELMGASVEELIEGCERWLETKK